MGAGMFAGMIEDLKAQGTSLNPRIENQRAQRNRSQALLRDQRLSRKLGAALLLASQGKWSEARPKLLPALIPGHPRIQVPWGRRETRDFHLLLRRILAKAPATAREAWTRNLENEASRRLLRVQKDIRKLRGFARAFEGTKAARAARFQALDLALEQGKLLSAETLAADLALPPQSPFQAAIRTLATRVLPSATWPSPPGLPNGTPPDLSPKGTPIHPPKPLGAWPGGPILARLALAGPRPGGGLRYFFLGSHKLGLVERAKGVHRIRSLDLPGLFPPDSDAGLQTGPKAAGSKGTATSLLVILQAQATFLLPSTKSKLYALTIPAKQDGTLKTQWSFSPKGAQLVGRLLAARGRVFVLSSKKLDPVTIQLSVHCLGSKGEVLWSRDLLRGAPLTKELAEHRQESLRGGFFRPSRPILDQGRLYIGTGLGLTFCLDPLDGSPLWSFRYARLPALGDREEPWKRGGIAGGTRIWHCPTDSNFLYLLRKDPGPKSLLQRPPLPKGSLRFFLGPLGNRVYFYRKDWLEMGPVRLSFPPQPSPYPRYDAPPIQPGEQLIIPPLLTRTFLLQLSNKTLYLNEIRRDLFYTKALPIDPDLAPYLGPALPTPSGFLFGGPQGPSLWH